MDPNSISGGYGPVHYGADYGTAPGQPIFAPNDGTVQVDTDIAGYGNRIKVLFDDGTAVAFGHVAGATVTNGERVNSGQQIGITGQNVGNSIGSVTLVEWLDQNGHYLNPHELLDPIFSGAGGIAGVVGGIIQGTGRAAAVPAKAVGETINNPLHVDIPGISQIGKGISDLERNFMRMALTSAGILMIVVGVFIFSKGPEKVAVVAERSSATEGAA